MPYFRRDQIPVFTKPQQPQFDPASRPGYPATTRPVASMEAPLSPIGFVLGLAVVGIFGLICADALADNKPERRCTGCGGTGHDRRTCGYTGQRRHFSRSIPRSKRCECCGKYGYDIQRHHPRGRADDSDWLDVCNGCHLHCCHKGDFNNLATKPRSCQFTGQDSYWRISR